MRRLIKRNKGDFSLIATHAKLNISKSGAGKGFCLSMKSITVRAFNTPFTKVINLPRWIKGVTCNRKMNSNK